MSKIKAKYKPIIIKGSNEHHSPIIKIEETSEKGRLCNCCKCRKDKKEKYELELGCDNYSTSVCICDQCLIILYDTISEFLDIN